MVKQNRNVMSFVDVLAHPCILRRRAARNRPAEIETTQDLLQKTKTLAGKQALAAKLQIHIQHVHKWSALADLAQIPAVGCQYCGLLLHSGISSSGQLAEMPLQNLHKLILRFYVATLQRQDLCPPKEQLVQWIQQAQVLLNRQ
jgi:hypothetical protein